MRGVVPPAPTLRLLRPYASELDSSLSNPIPDSIGRKTPKESVVSCDAAADFHSRPYHYNAACWALATQAALSILQGLVVIGQPARAVQLVGT